MTKQVVFLEVIYFELGFEAGLIRKEKTAAVIITIECKISKW